MKKYKSILILFNLALLLAYFVYSVIQKETLLKEGSLVLLELAPVDPRSLMQGDYMDLRYKIAIDLRNDSLPKRGYCIVQPDDHRIAQLIRVQAGRTPLNKGEQLIEYSSPNPWNISIGAESFFFQEGDAAKYDSARYGGIKVNSKGNTLLIGLYDDKLNRIK